MLIAQISDTHIKANGRLAYGIVDTAGMLRSCIEHIVRMPTQPDVMLLTGDLVDLGRPEEYALLQELLAPLKMPLYLVAGNHDERTALRQAFTGPGFDYLAQADEFLQYAVDLGPVRLLVMDTVVPLEGRGALCEQRLSWLDRRLAEDTRPNDPEVAMRNARTAATQLVQARQQIALGVKQQQPGIDGEGRWHGGCGRFQHHQRDHLNSVGPVERRENGGGCGHGHGACAGHIDH